MRNCSLAASAVRLDRLAPERNAALSGLRARGSWLSLHTCLDLACHGKESLLNIGRGLC